MATRSKNFPPFMMWEIQIIVQMGFFFEKERTEINVNAVCRFNQVDFTANIKNIRFCILLFPKVIEQFQRNLKRINTSCTWFDLRCN